MTLILHDAAVAPRLAAAKRPPSSTSMLCVACTLNKMPRKQQQKIDRWYCHFSLYLPHRGKLGETFWQPNYSEKMSSYPPSSLCSFSSHCGNVVAVIRTNVCCGGTIAAPPPSGDRANNGGRSREDRGHFVVPCAKMCDASSPRPRTEARTLVQNLTTIVGLEVCC